MTGEHSPVRRIAERVRPGATVERVEPVEAGNRRWTAVAHFADADPVVIQLDADPEITRVEARLLDAIVERTSIPVPTPHGYGTVNGHGWLATPLITGEDLHRSFTDLDPTGRCRIAHSFGRYLAELHDAFRFDSYGPLTVSDGELAVEDSGNLAAGVADDHDGGSIGDGSEEIEADTAAAWRRGLAAFGRASLARLPSEFDSVRADIDRVLEGTDIESAPVPRLFPWDFRPGNALVADGCVAAVLDWEGPLAAAPALSVAKTEYLVADWYVGSDAAESLREVFRAGYESVREYPSVQPIHRITAVLNTAVDSRGRVTNPGYPPVARTEAVRFHRRTLKALL